MFINKHKFNLYSLLKYPKLSVQVSRTECFKPLSKGHKVISLTTTEIETAVVGE